MQNEELSIKDLFYILFKSWYVIIISIFCCVIIALVYSQFMMPDKYYYATSASMIINSKTYVNPASEIEYKLSNDINLSQKMVNTYRVILMSDNVLERVIIDLDISFSAEDIRKWISVSSPKDTEVIIITVQNEDPHLAAAVANSIIKLAPEVITETIEVGSINVLDEAKVREIPIATKTNRKIALNLAIASVLGLMIGVFYVFLVNLIRVRVRHKEDIINYFNIKCLAEILHVKKSTDKDEKQMMITQQNVDPLFLETFKTLAEKIDFMCTELKYKAILIAGPLAEEGKTTVSLNLALTLASKGKKTIFIDCDLYNSFQSNHLKISEAEIPSNGLDQHPDLSKAFYTEPLTGLDILLFDKHHRKTYERVVTPDQFNMLLESLKQNYDYIIIDTAPILLKSDAIFIAKHVDGVLLVVAQEQTTVKEIHQTIETLKDIGASILGVALNNIRYLIGTEYRKKYYYYKKNPQYCSENNCKASIEANNGISKKKILKYAVLFIVAVAIVFWFANTPGDTLIEMSETSIQFIFDLTSRFDTNNSITIMNDAKISGLSWTDSEVVYFAKAMEHWIHSILSFMLTIITFNLLRAIGFKSIKSVIGTVIFVMYISIANEIYQSLYIEKRGYELIDVAFFAVGMIVAFICMLAFHFIVSNKRPRKKAAHHDKFSQ